MHPTIRWLVLCAAIAGLPSCAALRPDPVIQTVTVTTPLAVPATLLSCPAAPEAPTLPARPAYSERERVTGRYIVSLRANRDLCANNLDAVRALNDGARKAP